LWVIQISIMFQRKRWSNQFITLSYLCLEWHLSYLSFTWLICILFVPIIVVILWHAQFSCVPLVELSIALAGIVGSLLIGYMAKGGFVSHPDIDYVPTEEMIQSIYYTVVSLLGMAFVLSFGVSQMFWSREAALITHFNSQGLLRGFGYVISNVFRSMVNSILLATPWIFILVYILGCEGANTALLVANCTVFSIMWTTLCTFVCALFPIAYSAHALLYLNCIGLLFSGLAFNWKYLYKGFKVIHYANPLFLFSSACAYLFLEDVNPGCEDHDGLLHYGQCLSGQRAFEVRGMPMVNSLVAQSIALIFIVLSSTGLVFFILKGPKSCETKIAKKEWYSINITV